MRLSNDTSKKSGYDSNEVVIVPNKNIIITSEKNNNINNENNSDNENTFLNNEDNINNSDKEKNSNSDDDNNTVINNEKNLNNENNNDSSFIGGKNNINNKEVANNNEENVSQEENKKTFQKGSQVKRYDNTKRKYLYSSSDEENELQTYLNNYFSEKNIKKYSKNTQNNNSNYDNNNKNIDENNFQNEKEKRTLINEKVNNYNNKTILERDDDKDCNKDRTEITNKNINEKFNDNQEIKSKSNKNEPKKPFMISSELLTRSNSNISEQERNISVNNLKNLIKRINSNQLLNKENQMTELENKGNNNVNNVSNILSQTSSTGTDDDMLLDIKNNNNTREIHRKVGSTNNNSFDKSNIYFSYSNIFEDIVDFSLSNSSIEYDNYLSKTIEKSKKLINFPKVSEKHKKLYIRYCRELCKKTHKTKKEMYELLHQCNGSFPAVKELLKMKNKNMEELSDNELKKWIWTKEEDKILLTSKDEQQLKKIRLMKGNKSVRYRELYLEAKEIYNKQNLDKKN